jgi:hypothetical protein
MVVTTGAAALEWDVVKDEWTKRFESVPAC